MKPSTRPAVSPGVTPAVRPAARPAVRPTPVRPAPAVRPTVPRPAVPASLRAGNLAARQVTVRTNTRTAFTRTAVVRTTPARANIVARRTAHATAVRASLRARSNVIFTNTWWNARRHLWGGWRWHWCHRHRPYYWWRWATWARVSTWVVYDYTDPWLYDYDYNVVFEDENVWINDEPVAAAEDYISVADELASIEEPAEDAEIEWMSLGTFALATSDEDTDPQMMIQLVLAKDGRVAGTYYHFRSQNMFPIQGSLDGETQRVAFRIGDQKKNSIEAGLESLTMDEAPLWVHFEGGNRTQTWTLIRLEEPEWVAKEAGQAGDSPAAPPEEGAKPD